MRYMGETNMWKSKFGQAAVAVLLGLIAAIGTNSAAAAYSYKMTTAITMPLGSAGASLATIQPTNTKFTPCIAIIADSTTVNFDAPNTWTAWDVATVVFSQPWTGTTTRSCL